MEVAATNYATMTKYHNYVILKLSGEINDTQADEYLAKTLPEVIKTGFDLIINCDYLTNLSRGWLRALTVTEQKIREKKKAVQLILVPSDIQRIFKDAGLSRVLKTSNNLRDALLTLGLVNKKSLDVGFINPFLAATMEILKVTAQVEAKAGSVFMKKDPDLSGDISGSIGLVSDSFNGNVIITFPEKTFLNLMSKMHKETYTEINKDNADGAGEISNMIFGQAKIVLNEQGYGIKTALPSVIVGKGHRFSSGTQGPIVVVPFESPAGNFFVEICLSDNEAAQPK